MSLIHIAIRCCHHHFVQHGTVFIVSECALISLNSVNTVQFISLYRSFQGDSNMSFFQVFTKIWPGKLGLSFLQDSQLLCNIQHMAYTCLCINEHDFIAQRISITTCGQLSTSTAHVTPIYRTLSRMISRDCMVRSSLERIRSNGLKIVYIMVQTARCNSNSNQLSTVDQLFVNLNRRIILSHSLRSSITYSLTRWQCFT